MLRPIKTIALKKAGLSLRFARRVMERAAVLGGYDLSESELVFAMGAARERDDLLSVLELMDEVLALLRRGFDRRANRLTVKIINNIGIILGRGGFSRDHFNVLELHGKLTAAAENGGGKGDIPRLYAEIREQRDVLIKERAFGNFRGNSVGGLRENRGVTNRMFRSDRSRLINERVSERGSLTLNTLNSGLLRISARDPELLKMLKSDKVFRELSAENIERLHKRAERSVLAARFLDVLTEEQIGALERFVTSENLFSELREKLGERQGLKFLIENSSERSLARFFETLRLRIEQSGALSEKSFFRSSEDMKEFFIRATRGEVERLISRLEKERLYGGEVRTLVGALRIYDENIKAQKSDDEIRAAALELSEFEKVSETELRNIVNSADFSEERFIESLKSSSALKNAFAEFAWENYRSEKTLERYREYNEKLSERSKTLLLGNDPIKKENDRNTQGTFGFENSGSSAADEAAKERFAEFMINSGELSLIFSESIKNDFLGASVDVNSAFAEYLVSTVREDSSDYFNDRVRELAEKSEDILYRRDPDLGSKSDAVISLIRSEWERCSPQVSEMYAAFTRRGRYEEIIKFYLRMPKDDRAAVSELFFAAAQDNADFNSRSAELLARSEKAPIVTERSLAEKSRHTFLDAVNRLSDSAFESLKTLVEARGVENYSAVLGNSAEGSLSDERAAALVISAAFAEFFVSEVRGAESYSERMRELAERIAIIINNEYAAVESRAAEALELIYNTKNGGADELSRLYKDFAECRYDSEKLLEAYSRLSGSGFDSVSEKMSSDGGKALLSEYIEELTERSDALIEQLRAAVGGSFTLNSEKYSAKLLDLLGEKRGELQGDRFVQPAERVKLILRDDKIDIKERMAKTLELIQSAEGGSAELSELYERFSERYSDKQALLDIYSRLPGSEIGDLAECLSSDKDETQRTEFSERVLERSEKLIERLRGVDKQRVNSISQSKAGGDRDTVERTAELVVSTAFLEFLSSTNYERSEDHIHELTERRERLKRAAESVIYGGSANYYREAVQSVSDNAPNEESGKLIYSAGFAINQASKRSGLAEKTVLQKLFKSESLSGLRSVLTSVRGRADSRVYSILQRGVYFSSYSSVNKAFYKAFLAFEGGHDSESVAELYSTVVPREYLYILEHESVIQFNRLAADRLRERISEFLERRKTFTEAISERAAENILLSDRFMERNSAVELFYTDDYIESSSNSAVNYAIPTTAPASGSSNDVSDKLKALHSAVESIGNELERMKNRENEFSREFVTKSEQRVFEKEFRSSIEQDIFLAGKRHGIY